MMACAVVSLALLSGGRLLNRKNLRGSLDRRTSAAAAVWVMGALGLWAVWALSGGALVLYTGGMTDASDTLRRVALIGLGAHAVAMVVGLLYIRLAFHKGRDNPFTARLTDVVVGVVGLVLAFPIVYLIGTAAYSLASRIAAARGAEAPDIMGHTTLQALTATDTTTWHWLVILDVVLLAPLFEEIVYRGFLQTGLVRLMRSPLLGIALTSVIFSLMHAGSVPVYTLATLFAVSIGFGVVFERTGRIGAPIVMHAAFNALNLWIAMR